MPPPPVHTLFSWALSVPHSFIKVSFMLSSNFLPRFPREHRVKWHRRFLWWSFTSIFFSIFFLFPRLLLRLTFFCPDFLQRFRWIVQEMSLIASWGNYTHFLSVCLPIATFHSLSPPPPSTFLWSGTLGGSHWRALEYVGIPLSPSH